MTNPDRTDSADGADAAALGAPAPRVVVLMSTYNGERYVVEQLHSILKQLPPGGRIVVRDDGSRDGTAAAVEALRDDRIALVRGRNLGFARSFLTLLASAPSDADMVMLSDQDDVWLPGKIERAWQHLQAESDVPALYGSAQMLADAELRPLRPTLAWRRPPSFEGAVVENVITGCTAALNAPAVRLLQRAGVPASVCFHDWWIYLVVSAFGRVVFDPRPSLLYRHHGGTQIGHGAGRLRRAWMMARFLWHRDWVGILLGQVEALLAAYGRDLDAPRRQMIQYCFDRSGETVVPGWRLVFSMRRWRERLMEDAALRVLLAAYRLGLWPPPGRRRRTDGAISDVSVPVGGGADPHPGTQT